jgi:hypothetical protein
MAEANYSIRFISELPDYIGRGNYPRKWSVARQKLHKLIEEPDSIMVVSLNGEGEEGKRQADLLKSAVYSEQALIKRELPSFQTTTRTHESEAGSYSVYVLRIDQTVVKKA